MTPTDEAAVLKFAIAGHEPKWITQALGATLQDVVITLETYGWPDKNKMQWGVDELLGDNPAERAQRAKQTQPAYRAPGRVVPPRPHVVPAGQPRVAPAHAPAVVTPGASLLDRGKKSPSARTRTLTTKIERLLTDLAGRLEADAKIEAATIWERVAKEAAQAKVTAAKAAYEQALAEASGVGVARTIKHRTSSTSELRQDRRQDKLLAAHAITVKELKTWAKANDIDVPTAGRFLPAHLLDAYEAAHPAQESA